MIFTPGNDAINWQDIEQCIVNSLCVVVVLTPQALKSPEVVFSLTAAKHYVQDTSQVILVHDSNSCNFPAPDEQPSSVTEFFSEKAVTYLPGKKT